eukprot:2371405-Amphidinium_carterae.1
MRLGVEAFIALRKDAAAAIGLATATPYKATEEENSQGLGAGQVGDRHRREVKTSSSTTRA